MLDGNEAAQAALFAIPADLPREDWVRAGMAAHAAGLDFDTFNNWSAQGGTYSPSATRDVWRSFKHGKGIGPGTLVRMARDFGGFQAPGSRLLLRPTQAPERPQGAPKPPGQGISAAEVWNRCKPASEAHPYIQHKQGITDGLRVVPDGDPLRIAGESMAGALVVPVLREDGSLSTLQLIPPPETVARLKAQGKPGKLNLPGHSIEGWFCVGEATPGAITYLCEGIGHAWAAWQATGCAAIACFGWGRIRAVAQALRQRDAIAQLVLLPDVGKEKAALTIASEVQARVVCMPEGWPQNSDVNDLAKRDGFEALRGLLSGGAVPEPRYRLLSATELAALPPPSWRVRGVLPATGLAALYGQSASGKSFLALDMAAAIAEGARWFDCRTEAAPVVYVALEGEDGFRLRVAAWQAHRARALPTRLHMILQPFKLTEAGDVCDLAAVVPAGAVVFIDTLNRATPTSDENSSRDMGEILEAAKQLQALTNGLIVLMHHTGKDAARGLRGHSSLFAAMDAAVEVSREGERREWRVAKSKDGADGACRSFRLQVETLGTDDYGDAVTSCVVVPDRGAEEVQRVKLPAGGNQRVVLDTLRPMFREGAFGKPGAPPTRPCLELEVAVTRAAGSLTCEKYRRTTRAREAITGLVGRGVLGCNDGWLWLAA